MIIKTITHYHKDDIECGRDYSHVTIEIDGVEVALFGDYYHDKGEEMAAGFVKGVMWGRDENQIKLEREWVADADLW